MLRFFIGFVGALFSKILDVNNVYTRKYFMYNLKCARLCSNIRYLSKLRVIENYLFDK